MKLEEIVSIFDDSFLKFKEFYYIYFDCLVFCYNGILDFINDVRFVFLVYIISERWCKVVYGEVYQCVIDEVNLW